MTFDETVRKETLYWCQLKPHPEGRFYIGENRYRPEWPRSPDSDRDDDVVRKIVEEGIDFGNRIFVESGQFPAVIDIWCNGNLENMRIRIDQNRINS